MNFPITELMDQDACYARLVEALHPDGLACPLLRRQPLGVHRRHREPVPRLPLPGLPAGLQCLLVADQCRTVPDLSSIIRK